MLLYDINELGEAEGLNVTGIREFEIKKGVLTIWYFGEGRTITKNPILIQHFRNFLKSFHVVPQPQMGGLPQAPPTEEPEGSETH